MICVNALACREKNLLLNRFACGLRVGTRGSESMWKGTEKSRDPNGRAGYKASLRELQIELVKVQSHIIKHGHRVLVIFEGRDASGKDGTIKRIVQHLSPRETRVVALSALCPVFAGGAGIGPVQSQLVQPGERRTCDGFLLGQ